MEFIIAGLSFLVAQGAVTFLAVVAAIRFDRWLDIRGRQ